MACHGIIVILVFSVRFPFCFESPKTDLYLDPDGIAGPLQIHGPSSLNYDEDLGPILISDWIHADAFSLFHTELTHPPPATDSNIMNGHGVFLCDPLITANCTGKYVREELQFKNGKTYKMTIVNTSSEKHFTFVSRTCLKGILKYELTYLVDRWT